MVALMTSVCALACIATATYLGITGGQHWTWFLLAGVVIACTLNS
jgi:hypothetical protein